MNCANPPVEAASNCLPEGDSPPVVLLDGCRDAPGAPPSERLFGGADELTGDARTGHNDENTKPICGSEPECFVRPSPVDATKQHAWPPTSVITPSCGRATAIMTIFAKDLVRELIWKA